MSALSHHLPRSLGAGAPIRVVLTMDDAMARRELRLSLHARGGVEVVAETASNEAAARLAQTYAPRVLILDGDGGEGLPLQLIGELQRTMQETGVIVLTGQQEPAAIGEAFRAGAVGYVLKISAAEELARAVRSAARSHLYLTPGLGARLGAMPVTGGAGRRAPARHRSSSALVAPGTRA